MNDRDSIVGAFVGNPLAREVHWGGQQYDDCLGVDCPYCRIGQSAQFRVSINFFVPKKNEMRIIEGGERWFRDLLKVRNKYGLDKWFFEVERRHDTSKSWPRYSILPDRKIGAAQLETIRTYKLHDLKAIFSRPDQTQCLDSEIVTEFTTRLNSLASSDVSVFFQQLCVSNVSDIPAVDESAAHSKHIVEQFQQAGVAAEHLDGATSIEERDAILQRLESGETTLVSNCSVLAEGYDQPAVKCAILARPTKSTGLYLQQAGRILRPYNGQRAIILDHGGCVLQHGLPQQDRVFSLEGTKKRGTGSQTPVTVCSQCYAVLPLNTHVCPECGHVLFELEKQGIPKEREGDLVEVFLQDEKSKELNRLRNIAAAHGYKPGWVFYRYKERFGEAPPSQYQNPNPWRMDEQAVKKLLRQAARSGGVLEWKTVDSAIERMGRVS